ncbi:MAG: 3-methyl-2-oxobutanoate hydroxymethyltransferase [Actinobacteria bacterium]|nr:3-methyl-2-oxobutanoate hydroxymethyltransferase [Actinomycetota bacterium]MCA1719613.1 3-methyl-2-oxobutanoate hydroxymethyltransferase [Actinomycetota bacterium]
MTEPTLYGGVTSRRVTVRDLQAAKDRGERWAMLTSYDMLTAALFDAAGIPVLLVGDSAGNNVLGYETTVPVTVEDLVPLVRGVARATTRSLVVADLPFGSYQGSPAQALDTAVRFLREGAQAVKLEGGRRVLPQVSLLVESGVPVMGHLGLTPQSVNTLGGYRVQGRGEAGDLLIEDALALQEAGAFAVVLEVVPSDLAERVSKELTIPTVGIGAGPGCDAQVLVWTDLAGLTPGPGPKFLKRYADLRTVLTDAVTAYADDVRNGTYPAAEHGYT